MISWPIYKTAGNSIVMPYKTLLDRNLEEARMKLVTFPQDTLAIVYVGRDDDGNREIWNIRYSLVLGERGYALRTVGSETPHIVDDKSLNSSSKKNAWLEGFMTLADDVEGAMDSLPIRPVDAEEIRGRLREYHGEIYPDK